MRYPNDLVMQNVWEGWLREDLEDSKKQIEFLRGLAGRQVMSKSINEKSNQLIREREKHIHYLEQCLLKGDYI